MRLTSWMVAVEEDGAFQDSTYVVDAGRSRCHLHSDGDQPDDREKSVRYLHRRQPAIRRLEPDQPLGPADGQRELHYQRHHRGKQQRLHGNAWHLVIWPRFPRGQSPRFPTALSAATNANFSRTLTITTSGVTPGTYPFTVRAQSGSNCQGNGDLTVSGTLIVFGAPAKLAFGEQPSNTASTATITPPVTVRVLDPDNNLVANSTASITLAIGTNPGGGTLTGTLTQNAVDGVATFADLKIDKVGTGYTLVATSSGLNQATSSAFNILLGPAAKLAFFTQPSGAAPNTPFATQPQVEVQDAGGNRRTSGAGSGAPITLAIVPGSGTAGAVLSCAANTVNASAGLATFAGCNINLTGTNYRLRATSGGLTAADSDPFNITPTNQAPNVNAGGPYTVKEGTELTLTPTVTDPDGDALTYHWSFITPLGIDAGGTCTFDNQAAKNAKVTCTDDSDDATGAKFTLTLTVDDGTAPPVSDNADLKVTNENPVADAGGPYASAAEGSPIQLSGSGDDPGDNDDSHLGYHWTVDDSGITGGGSCDFDNPASKNAKVTCDDNGFAIVSLVVSDDDGGTSVASTATVTFTNADPVADAGPGYDGDEGEVIQLNGTVSDVGENDLLTWSWAYAPGANVDPGATCDFSDENALDPTISCTDDGEVTLTLKVEDDDGGEDTDTAILTLSNVAPVANAGGPYTGAVEGTAINLSGSATDQGTNDTHTFQWTVDDSGIDGGGSCTIAAAADPTTTITCDDNGTLKVSLVATDDDGGVSTASQATISIANVDPEITAFTKSDGTDLPSTLIVAGTLGLKAAFDDDGTNDTHTLAVDCGSGTFAAPTSASSPAISSCNFPTIGPVTIRIKVADDDGGYRHPQPHDDREVRLRRLLRPGGPA